MRDLGSPPEERRAARARRRQRKVGRRRLAALGAAALVALIAGVSVGANGDAGGESGPATADSAQQRRLAAARAVVDRLTLRQQVGQVTISSFQGTTRPEYIRRRLRARETAGVILFGGTNGGDAAHWRRLTRSLREAGHGRTLILVDQEGGDIRTVAHVGPQEGQPFQGSPASVRRSARAAGRGLRAAGVNVNLAPVADVPRAGSFIATRAFPGDEHGIAARTTAAVRGLGAAGVAATAKHFPGLGAATVNTDDGPSTVRASIRRDLVPFRAAIEAQVPLVMLSHATYPALDPSRIASQSRPIVTGLLRRRLGFEGVSVTDSLEAAAVVARSGIAKAAERSIRAGADLILMTGSASWNDVYPHLLGRARRDRALRERIRESAARVLALKSELRRPG